MILHTGGRALGATSTRSIPDSRARRIASAVLVEPTFTSFWSMRKIGEMRICSLWRKFVEMAKLSCCGPKPARRAHARLRASLYARPRDYGCSGWKQPTDLATRPAEHPRAGPYGSDIAEPQAV